jgi:beta-phosphoglucomutase
MSQFAVIWDVDGTLVDTAALHLDAWIRLSQEMGREFSKADFAATFGRRNPEIIEYLFQRPFSPQEIHDIGERKESYYRAEAEKGIELLPGVRRLLQTFHEQAIRQAIGSSAPRGNLEMIIRITDSAHYFQAMVGMEDTSRGKPDPEVFLTAANKISMPPERCIVFEDAIAGVQAAKAGGMKCVGVTFVGHHPAEKLLAAGADRVITSFDELTAEDVAALMAR